MGRIKHGLWRFAIGDAAFVVGWAVDSAVTIVEQRPVSSGFPHYIVMDAVGDLWLMSQLRLSAKAIVTT